jgi:hypothetical protein
MTTVPMESDFVNLELRFLEMLIEGKNVYVREGKCACIYE